MPEAEFRQTWVSTADGRPVKACELPGSQALMTIMTSVKRYTDIPAPALVLFAIPHVRESWIDSGTDPAVRKAARAYFTRIDALAEKQAKAVEDGVHTAHVIRLGGAHYIVLSNEADVLRELRAFVAGLK
jgi:predicted LPLAT superfamily acyltransferase